MKITVQYQPGVEDEEAKRYLDLLKPGLKGAKMHEKYNHPPFKHIYITPRKANKPTK